MKFNSNLDMIVEECSEIIQACQKIKRFGAETEYNNTTNIKQLLLELADLSIWVDNLLDSNPQFNVDYNSFYQKATIEKSELIKSLQFKYLKPIIPMGTSFHKFIRNNTKETLINTYGFSEWDCKGISVLLIPENLYDYIPEKYLVIDIFGQSELFKNGKTSRDSRCGVLSYGVIKGQG